MGVDALAYWMVEVPGTYDIPHRVAGSFPYAPPIAMLMDPFGQLPFWQFLWLWTALLVGSLIWIGRSVSWILVALAIPFVAVELYLGNIHILLAVAILLGRNYPWTWAFVLLTKTTCGVGLLWFVVRREWRNLGVALGATAAIAAVTFVLQPTLWFEWVDYVIAAQGIDNSLWNNAIHIPLWIRLLAAVAIIAWGARSDRYWTVLVGATLALPVLWMHGFALLVGLVAEVRRHQDAKAETSLAGSAEAAR